MVKKESVYTALAGSVIAEMVHNVEKIIGRKLEEEEVTNTFVIPIFYFQRAIETVRDCKEEDK